MSEILTLNEAAARLHVTRRTLERWTADGIGPQITKIGPRRVGVVVDDLDDWIAARRRIGLPVKPIEPVPAEQWDGRLTPQHCRAARVLLGLNQTRLAALAGLTQIRVSRFENGERNEALRRSIHAALSERGVRLLEGGHVELVKNAA